MDFFQSQEKARKRTMLLVVLFVVAVILIIAGVYATFTVAAAFMVEETRPHGETGPAVSLWSPGRALFAAVVVLGVVGFSAMGKIAKFSRGGGPAVAESMGARRIDPGTRDPQERRFFNVVEEMAIASGLPVPAVYVLDKEEGINGFAAGNRPDDAAVALTRGALEALDRDELQGVVAHEFSHILNGDMRMNIRLAGVLFGLLVLSIIGNGLLRAAFRGSLYRGMTRRGGGRGNNGGMLVIAFVGVALFLLGLIGQFFGRLIQAAISRQREFLADAAAVQFTRNPQGISGALQRIGAASRRGKVEDSQAETAAHFFFANAMHVRVNGLLATHPPLPKRIRAVDPAWDGKYEARKKRPAPAPAPKEPAKAAGGRSGGGAPLFGHGGSTQEKIASGVALAAFLQAIGSVSPEAVARARELIAGLPEALREAVHEPQGSRATVAALLLGADSDVRAKQVALLRKAFSDEFALRVTRLFPHTFALADTGRMPVLELCLPALKQGADDADAFVDRMREVADVDGQLHLFECLILAVLEARLRGTKGVRESAARLDGPAAATVLSGFARIEAPDEAGAKAIFTETMKERGMSGTDFNPPEDNAALERALVKLRGLNPGDRKQLLSAAACIVWHNGEVSPAEGEWLRALAAVLECPVPSMAEK
ncbi:MAG: M48 family metallopeptidase [Opitutales bacterium]|nr:M48 family metallopeptidase [Opitutales bacterium]